MVGMSVWGWYSSVRKVSDLGALKHCSALIVATVVLSCCVATSSAAAETVYSTIATVTANHPSISSVRKLQRSADEDLTEARSGYFPVITLDGKIGTTKVDQLTGNGGTHTSEIAGGVSVPLYDGMRTRNLTRAAKASQDVAAFEVINQQVKVAFEAAQVFIDVQRTRELETVSRANVGRVNDLSRKLAERAKSDPGLRSEITLGAASVMEAEIEDNIASQDAVLAADLFLQLVGRKPNALAQVNLKSLALPSSMEQVLQTVTLDHPSVRSANSEAEKELAKAEADRSRLHPNIDLVGQIRAGENLDGNIGRDNSSFVGLKMSFKFSTGGGEIAHARSSTLRAEASKDQVLEAQLRVRKQVLTVWSEWQVANKNYQTIVKRKRNSDEMMRAYEGQFAAGERKLLEFFFVLKEQNEARKAEVNARYDRILAGFKLLAAMGRMPASG
ncbi:TolC family protein [Allorhizobium pseudoryzae]|uniref:TolC family protein n=1 Tax=Allorhizobium pseudoryzae TaxID=379684 RepID=UPI003CFC1AEB